MHVLKAHKLERQRGMTLLVSLVLLVLMTLLALVAIRLTTGNLRVVGNMQLQQEATSAAQAAVNTVISTSSNLTNPSLSPTTMNVDVNGTTYTVGLTQPCLVGLQNLDLLPSDPDATICTDTAVWPNPSQTGCALTTWQLTGTVNDADSGAFAEVTQGVNMRMDAVTAEVYKNNPAMVCS